MSKRDMHRIGVLSEVIAERRTVASAAGVLAVSVGHVPEARPDHPVAQRLARDHQRVMLRQHLCGQRRAEVSIILTDQRQRVIADARLDPIVGRPSRPVRPGRLTFLLC